MDARTAMQPKRPRIADAARVPPERARCAVAAQPAALAEFQGQPARLLVAVDFPRPVRPEPVRRIHRQRPAAPRLLQGRDPVSGPRRLIPKTKFGGDFDAVTDYRDPFIAEEIEARLDDLAADPLLLRHASISICRRPRPPSRPGCYDAKTRCKPVVARRRA